LRQIRSSYRHFDFAARVHRQGFSTSIFSAAGSKPRFSLGCAVPKVLDLACRSSFRGQRPLLGLSLVTSSPSALLLLSFSARFWFDPSQLPRYVLIIRLRFGLSAKGLLFTPPNLSARAGRLSCKISPTESFCCPFL
jgi:hypothetical protein